MNLISSIPVQYRLQIAVLVLCVAEAWLEELVIRLKNPTLQNYPALNRKEHRRSAIYYGAQVGMLILVSAEYDKWYYLVMLLLLQRRIFFEYALKLFRGKGLRFIEGDQPWDKISRNIFGYKGGVKELLVLIALVVAANLFLPSAS
jgi:hypothetical protein